MQIHARLGLSPPFDVGVMRDHHNLVSPAEELAPTRSSLLERLRDLNDRESWQEFFDTYWKLLYCAAVRGGLSDREAEDVVQETVLSVVRSMGSFRYQPSVCSFKGWLMFLTRHAVIDHLRKRRVRPDLVVPLKVETATDQEGAQIADLAAQQAFETMWDDEWERNLVDVALEKVKRLVSPKHYQVFYLHAVKNLPARRIAELLKLSPANVYVVRHRIGRLVRREVNALTRAGEERIPGRALAASNSLGTP
jgi:RNA polymerase sigma factor (sigma-70 family)